MNINQSNSLSGNCCKDCKEFLTGILNSMPFFIKMVICFTIVLYIINLIIPYVALFLADIPYFTIYYFQIWRLVTTPFMTTSFFSVIFSIFFWYDKASTLEKQIGTIKYMLIFFMNSLCIQILYNILMIILSLIIRSKLPLKMKVTRAGVRNEGLWPILLCDITLLCLSNPNEIFQFRFFPCTIKAKYYPFVLFLIFTILSGFQIEFENMCGIGYGFLFYYFLRNRLGISNNFANKVGNSCLCRWMQTKKGFIGNGGIIAFNNMSNNIRNVNINNTNNSSNNSSSNNNKPKENKPKGFTAFKGKGIAVGGGNNSISSSSNSSSSSSSQNENNKSESAPYTSVTVTSGEEANTSDSRIDLNNTNPKA